MAISGTTEPEELEWGEAENSGGEEEGRGREGHLLSGSIIIIFMTLSCVSARPS